METPIDIVIPWLNPTDDWFRQYILYKEDEHSCRIRDLKTIRPTIKGILKNLPWVRYIWLIVFDEKQIPTDWDELKNEKIRFVYHKDILPKEFLPNFNSMLPECYVNKISGLSENFIWSNDDIVYTKPIPKTYYFKDNKPVHRRKRIFIRKENKNNRYEEMCNSSAKFIQKIDGKLYWSLDDHMPIPLKKSMIDFLWAKHEKMIYESCRNSKIRKPFNLVFGTIVYTLDELHNLCVYDNNTDIKHKPIWISDKTTKAEIISAINNNHIVCLNDSENLNDNVDNIIKIIEESFGV